MPSPEQLPHYVYDDYRQWEGRWELIEGIPYAMTPAPGFEHQRISNNIAHILTEALADCPHCHPILPVDWRIADDTVVQPDNSVVCYTPHDGFLTRAPALIFEVLSPSTAVKDRDLKFHLYERAGVRHYGMVDPKSGRVELYVLRQGRYRKRLDARDDTVGFDLDGCRFDLDFSRIWPRI